MSWKIFEACEDCGVEARAACARPPPPPPKKDPVPEEEASTRNDDDDGDGEALNAVLADGEVGVSSAYLDTLEALRDVVIDNIRLRRLLEQKTEADE